MLRVVNARTCARNRMARTIGPRSRPFRQRMRPDRLVRCTSIDFDFDAYLREIGDASLGEDASVTRQFDVSLADQGIRDCDAQLSGNGRHAAEFDRLRLKNP